MVVARRRFAVFDEWMASATGTTTEKYDRVRVFGADWCPDCRRAKAVLDQSGVTYDYIDIEHDQTGPERARAISGGQHIPVVVFPDGVFYVEPTNTELGMKLAALAL